MPEHIEYLQDKFEQEWSLKQTKKRFTVMDKSGVRENET